MDIENLNNKFERLLMNISSPHFLEMKALGGELPFYIVTYSVKQENEVSKQINKLIHKLKHRGIFVLNIDLFDLIIEILEKENKLSKILQYESKLSVDKFLNNLKRVLDVNKKIIPAIFNRINTEYTKVVFLTGIGKCYPVIRSHYILKNLESNIHIPVILFFPGIYDGISLNLFGKMKDGNHYRAFNLDKINF